MTGGGPTLEREMLKAFGVCDDENSTPAGCRKRYAMIDPTGGTDYSQAQRLGTPLHGAAEKVTEVKEPRKTERSQESRLNTQKDRRKKHSKDKEKGFSLYV